MIARRIQALLLVTWAFQLAPSLCLAGGLPHHCKPDACCPAETDAVDCCSAHGSDEPTAPSHAPCSHESGCRADPCGQLAVQRAAEKIALDDTKVALPASAAVLLPDTCGSARVTPLRPPNLPIDCTVCLPLLI
jgi:hypothetical protein